MALSRRFARGLALDRSWARQTAKMDRPTITFVSGTTPPSRMRSAQGSRIGTNAVEPAPAARRHDNQRFDMSGGIVSHRAAAAIEVTAQRIPGRRSKWGKSGAARIPVAFSMPRLAI